MVTVRRLANRPTADLVVLLLAGLVAVIVVTAVAGVLVIALVRPRADVGGVVHSLSDVTNTLIGAVVGYIAGRGLAAKPPPDPLDPLDLHEEGAT